MLSFVDVQCPHCGAQGRIVLPPLGTLLIGPCPSCKGMVALFNGTTLPLDAKIILEGTMEEKKKHIVEVFGSFIEERVEEFFNPKKDESIVPDTDPSVEAFQPEHRLEEYSHKSGYKKPISREEILRFKEKEIDLIDNPETFKKYFSN